MSDDEDVENDNEELEDDDYNGYKNSDDYETDVMFEDEKSPRLRKENTHMDYEDIENDDEVIDNGSRLKRHFRSKRAIGGREQWRQSLPGYKKSKRKNRDEIVWEVCFFRFTRLSTLGKKVGRRHTEIYLLFFSNEQDLTYHANCLLYKMSKPILWEKYEKFIYHRKLSSAYFAQRKVNL